VLDADGRRRLDDRAQFWMQRHVDDGPGLLLFEPDAVADDVGRAEEPRIAPRAGVQHESHGQPRLAADPVCRLVAGNLNLVPSLVTTGLDLLALDAERRVVDDAASFIAHLNIARTVLRKLRCALGVAAFSLTIFCMPACFSSMMRSPRWRLVLFFLDIPWRSQTNSERRGNTCVAQPFFNREFL
jgi:hypothetical protein